MLELNNYINNSMVRIQCNRLNILFAFVFAFVFEFLFGKFLIDLFPRGE